MPVSEAAGFYCSDGKAEGPHEEELRKAVHQLWSGGKDAGSRDWPQGPSGQARRLHMTAGCWNEIFPGFLLTHCSLPTPASQIFTDSVWTLLVFWVRVLKDFLLSPLKILHCFRLKLMFTSQYCSPWLSAYLKSSCLENFYLGVNRASWKLPLSELLRKYSILSFNRSSLQQEVHLM